MYEKHKKFDYMAIISSSELKMHFGEYLEKALQAPIHISKTKRSVAVLMSEQEYERLTTIESMYLAQLAEEARQEGYVSQDKVNELLEKFKKED
jgi:prevent-host-death family protein